ncbi:hypothetical protein [Streptomyces sp. NPDC093261]|uniref:hypothetical protein n=1 Tax=Streptomyces sp. NPDC093261 TaxID=3366037 RepID=UPI0038018867
MPRLINNTGHVAQHPWPEDVEIQGGALGVVYAGEKSYRTAFVEAFPNTPPTFLRGEGATVAEAEDACWAKYERYRDCEHGPYERRQYTDGSGFCTQCGTWLIDVLEPLPEETPDDTRLINRLFSGDPEALKEVLGTMARADELPLGAPETGDDTAEEGH